MTSLTARRIAAVGIAGVLALGASGCGSQPLAANAATITNLGDGAADVHISRADFQDRVQELVENDRFRALLVDNEVDVTDESLDARITASLLTQMITQAAIDAEFEARDATVTEANREQAREQVAQQFGGQEVFAEFSESFQAELVEDAARTFAVLDTYLVEPTDADARAFYEENREQFDCASGREVAHILVADRAAADALMARLAAGEEFAALASENSTDTGSAQAGGSLGCLMEGAFVEEFQTAADNAALGTPVGPVQSEFGNHIILVTPYENSFENSYARVAEALQAQSQQDAQAAISRRLSGMEVDIDPRYGTWGESPNPELAGQFQVIPPESADVRDQREPTTTTTTPLGAGPGAVP
jgi:parvulin-like peptidyl-prolyl isomerase